LRTLGARHPLLCLEIASTLLGVEEGFAPREPHVDDPDYVCIMVLLLSAAQRLPHLVDALPAFCRRHYPYLREAYPDLFPQLSHAEARVTALFPSDGGDTGSSSAHSLGLALRHTVDAAASELWSLQQQQQQQQKQGSQTSSAASGASTAAGAEELAPAALSESSGRMAASLNRARDDVARIAAKIDVRSSSALLFGIM